MPVDGVYLRRIIDQAEQARARLRAVTPPPPSPERLRGLALAPGDRAIDLVTGHEVEVISGHQIADLVSAPKPSIG